MIYSPSKIWLYFYAFSLNIYQVKYKSYISKIVSFGMQSNSNLQSQKSQYYYFTDRRFNTKMLLLTSYVTPLSVPASHGIRSWTTFWAQPHSLVHKSSADRPTFQSGLGPSMVRKDMMWRVRSTENSAEGAARLRRRVRLRSEWIKAVWKMWVRENQIR